MRELDVAVKILPHFAGLDLPDYQTEGSSGFDLIAACEQPVVIRPGQRALVPTGLSVSLPLGSELQIRPRSGLALRHGITLLNSPGTIDSDYRGEIQLIMINLGDGDFTVTRGMRIGQAVFGEVIKAKLSVADNLDSTCRGVGGFGHTGIH
ncbi:MAG: dUTP diphosphatase [Candidatus Omnitrophota bacterium]